MVEFIYLFNLPEGTCTLGVGESVRELPSMRIGHIAIPSPCSLSDVGHAHIVAQRVS